MKLTTEELSELSFYIQEIRPDMVMTFREDNDEVLDFSDHDVVLYKARVNVMREHPETKEKTVKKEPVFFLETSTAEIRKSTSFSDICLALLIFCTAEDLRIGFDLVKQDYQATHPQQKGANRLQ